MYFSILKQSLLRVMSSCLVKSLQRLLRYDKIDQVCLPYILETVEPNDNISTEYAYFSPKLVLTMGNIMNGSDTCAFKITFVTKVSLKDEAYVSLCLHQETHP